MAETSAQLKALEDPTTREALEKGLEVLKQLNEAGLLDFAREASGLAGDSLSYLLDPKVLKIFSNVAYFLHLLELLEPTMLSVMAEHFVRELNREVTPELMKDPPRLGPMAFVRALGDPDVQKGLGFLFVFLKVLGRAFDGASKELLPLVEEAETTLAQLRKQREALQRELQQQRGRQA